MQHDDIRAVFESTADSRQAGRRMARMISDSLADLATDGEIEPDDIQGALIGLIDKAGWELHVSHEPNHRVGQGSK